MPRIAKKKTKRTTAVKRGRPAKASTLQARKMAGVSRIQRKGRGKVGSTRVSARAA